MSCHRRASHIRLKCFTFVVAMMTDAPLFMFHSMCAEDHIGVQTAVGRGLLTALPKIAPESRGSPHRGRIDRKIGIFEGQSVEVLDAHRQTSSQQMPAQLEVTDLGDDTFPLPQQKTRHPGFALSRFFPFFRMGQQREYAGVQKDGTRHGNSFRSDDRFSSRSRFKASNSPVSSSQSAASHSLSRAMAPSFGWRRALSLSRSLTPPTVRDSVRRRERKDAIGSIARVVALRRRAPSIPRVSQRTTPSRARSPARSDGASRGEPETEGGAATAGVSDPCRDAGGVSWAIGDRQAPIRRTRRSVFASVKTRHTSSWSESTSVPIFGGSVEISFSTIRSISGSIAPEITVASGGWC